MPDLLALVPVPKGVAIMYAAIMDKTDNRSFWEGLSAGSFHFDIFNTAGQLNLLPKPDVILVSAEYLTGQPGYTFPQLRAFPSVSAIPAAAVTLDPSCENQERLCEMGFDDVLCIPMSRNLFIKKLTNLVNSAHTTGEKADPEILSLMGYDGEIGSFCVRSEDFTYIYKYVLRLLERLDKDAQMLILTVDQSTDITDEKVIQVLSDVTQRCLRRGDVSAVCGENRVVVLLIGTDDEGGHLVASRIVSSFYSEFEDDKVRLNYDIRAVRARKNEKK